MIRTPFASGLLPVNVNPPPAVQRMPTLSTVIVTQALFDNAESATERTVLRV